VKYSALVLILIVGVVAPLNSMANEETSVDLADTALLVIDIQAFYFAEGKLPLVEPIAASLKAQELITYFRTAGRPVIHIQHLPSGIDAPDPTGIDAQYRIHPNVLPQKGEVVIGKHHANSFRDTDLLKTLRALGITKLVVCGMQTQMCVEAAVRAADDLGFDVSVVHDACATRDLAFDGVDIPAAQVHAAALAAMKSSYAKVITTADMCRNTTEGHNND